jgi:glycosyltransferase involved in cell wall biosynthesis
MTCLNQDFDDYEIIVCDNNSSPETKAVVDEMNDAKIRYVRSDVDLAMSDNWELAVSKAEGEYIIVMGDDDALLLGALKKLNEIIQKTNFEVIRWEKGYYAWPNLKPENFANQLQIPSLHSDLIVNGKTLIQNILKCNVYYDKLPMLYNSAVHRSLIDDLRVKTGRVFRSLSPDVYSGFAFAYLTGSFLSLGFPFSLNGCSNKSNGFSFLTKKSDNEINKDFQILNKKHKIEFPPEIPNVRSLFAGIAESFQKLKSSLFPNDKTLKIDRKLLIDAIFGDIRLYDENEYVEAIEVIKKSFERDSNAIQSYLNAKINSFKPTYANLEMEKKYPVGITSRGLIIDASVFGCQNIYDVVLLCQKIIDFDNYNFTSENINLLGKKMSWYRRVRTSLRIIIKGY